MRQAPDILWLQSQQECLRNPSQTSRLSACPACIQYGVCSPCCGPSPTKEGQDVPFEGVRIRREGLFGFPSLCSLCNSGMTDSTGTVGQLRRSFAFFAASFPFFRICAGSQLCCCIPWRAIVMLGFSTALFQIRTDAAWPFNPLDTLSFALGFLTILFSLFCFFFCIASLLIAAAAAAVVCVWEAPVLSAMCMRPFSSVAHYFSFCPQ